MGSCNKYIFNPIIRMSSSSNNPSTTSMLKFISIWDWPTWKLLLSTNRNYPNHIMTGPSNFSAHPLRVDWMNLRANITWEMRYLKRPSGRFKMMIVIRLSNILKKHRNTIHLITHTTTSLVRLKNL